MEVDFSLIKANPDIEDLQIYSHTFLIIFILVYTDDTILFLRNEKSETEVIKTLDKFIFSSGIKINNTQCEIAGIGVKKGVTMALCGMKCFDLTNDVITISGIFFTSNKKT